MDEVSNSGKRTPQVDKVIKFKPHIGTIKTGLTIDEQNKINPKNYVYCLIQ